MQQWLKSYWSGKRSFKDAFLVWGIYANSVWHVCVCIVLGYIAARLAGWKIFVDIWTAPAMLTLSILFLVGFLQALIVMPFSAKIISASLSQSPKRFITHFVFYVFAIYAILSCLLAIVVVVLMPIWWNS